MNALNQNILKIDGLNYKHTAFTIFLLLLFIIFSSGCQKDTQDPIPDPVYYIESEIIEELSISDIKQLLSTQGNLPPELSLLINNSIHVYKLVYRTVDTQNNEVLASGALIVPDNNSPLPLISFQHGTLSNEEDAPSYFSSDDYLVTVLFASAGYIFALPDYLGYGSSRQLDHPYEHGHSLASASRDMLRAVREFDLLNHQFQADDKLFLTGYSQGGYATMSLLKLLEEEHSGEFTVTAATAGAGAYNKTEFARKIIEADEELVHLNTFLWVLDTYNKIYGINRPYSYFFNEPHDSEIETGGVFSNTEINPGNLFTSEFRDGILLNSDSDFIEVIADNDNYDWKPVSPLQLYHGTKDEFVYYFNSESAYLAMKERGAENVELVTVHDGDHATTVFEYFTGTFFFFSRF